jgi:hypothetical protein
MKNLLADAGYSNGSNYNFLEQRNITGWIPVFGKYKSGVDGFTYNKETDEYTCPVNKPLPFKGGYTSLDGGEFKNYWAAPKDCKDCPMKSSCAPNIKCRKITRTAYDPQYLRAYERQHSEKGREMKRLRQSTVEPVFGTLTHYYGLRKIGVLGKAGAHKVMLMAAIAFNLKQYLKIGVRKPFKAFFEAIVDAVQRQLLTFSTYPINPAQLFLKAE